MSCTGIQKCQFCCRSLKCSDLDLINAYKSLTKALEGLIEARRKRENIHLWLDMVSSAKKKIGELI